MDRALTPHERAGLSQGLVAALGAAGVEPRIIDRVHPAARIASLWHGCTPILARPGKVFWPGAPADAARAGPQAMATLQHELQHVLEYAEGALTGPGYLIDPGNWRYHYDLMPGSAWSDFGAEQRASIAEHWWLIENGRTDLVERALRRPAASRLQYIEVLPWVPPL